MNKPLSPDGFVLEAGALTLNPGAETSLPVSPSIAAQKNLVLELTVTVKHLAEAATAPSAPPPGPSLPATGEIDYQGIKVQSAPAQTALPPWSPPTPPPRTDDLAMLFLQDGSKVVQLPDLKDVEGAQTLQIPISDYVQTLSAIDLRNRNTYRQLLISGIKIYDPGARGLYNPSNPVTQASDAVIHLDGIEVKRKSNTIDDVIPGVTLNLQSTSDKPITLDVAPDTKKIKDAIINFVGNYNKLMTTMEIYTNRDPAVVDEISYFSADEKKAAKEKLGLFQGDLTLAQVTSRLEEIMMNPYKTEAGRALSLLAQMGISTDTSTTFSGFDVSKLRGYLEIDEPKLDQALTSQLPSAKEIFGYDTNGDLIVDSGVAYASDQYLKGFSDTGGIIPSKLASIDQTIADTNRNIATLKDQLAQKEQELRDKYNTMQGAINSLQQSSKAIQGLGGQQGQSSGP